MTDLAITAAFDGLRRVAALALAALALASAAPSTVSASARICRQLEAELTATTGGGRSTAQVRRYDTAIARQREQLQIASQRSRDSNCGFSLFGRGGQCAAFDAKVRSMERNLAVLQQKRAGLAGAGPQRPRRQILAALDANDCGGDATAERSAPDDDRDGNLFQQIFGNSPRQLAPLENESNLRRIPGTEPDDIVKTFAQPAPSRQYRTLCVRSCDGYFFPMSNASSELDFDRDRKNCESACPGAEVEVYYHRAIGQESSDMVSSVSGAPYSDLPTAYRYKQSEAPPAASCGCRRPAAGWKIIAGNPPASQMSEPVSDGAVVTIPPPASIEAASPAPESASTTPEAKPGDRRIRVVGPTFLPDPKEAIDLRAPAPTEVR